VLRRRRYYLKKGGDDSYPLQTAPSEEPDPGSIGALLEAIRRTAPALGDRDLDSYCSYLDASEEQLAWETLVSSADRQDASREVWLQLVAAAEAMNIDAEDVIYGDAVRLATRHVSQ
jgi:hypothetical protein